MSLRRCKRFVSVADEGKTGILSREHRRRLEEGLPTGKYITWSCMAECSVGVNALCVLSSFLLVARSGEILIYEEAQSTSCLTDKYCVWLFNPLHCIDGFWLNRCWIELASWEIVIARMDWNQISRILNATFRNLKPLNVSIIFPWI